MVQPSILLAGTITVMGKFALPTVMELLLPLEAGVAHKVNEAGNKGRKHVIKVGCGAPWKGTTLTFGRPGIKYWLSGPYLSF